ncbi:MULTISPECIES: 1-phosphofructokinase [Chromohalobacter]|uniref:Phosphofructokinase n=1 Tax=Chromohalobacter israelensis (strain ATCC BAA-138 / DSM 3043 / CIP 106854 / NCIMB 13768 / 1H11) TaxID=290398 RepID=Q1QU64_CHRI1|nr:MULTISPECIES: 1-phosphofructokinase [Chromohalobacter]ABE59994.1 PfkB [Chromohalobacter salexigens DSM 3043]MBZ5875815.1 1-phosphofructokinase [Chromohalobacter salexigens]MDO0945795.1 1-phosphofructokinase [Chromohalobacter salexigens]NQY44952.1 1-phosphofructokinase [Chromohalobacter sp.]NWO56171.1 1-phosphofructokinase [Chromohalobacter salexigens]
MARVLTLTLNPALDLAIRLPALTLGAVNRTDATHLEAAGKGVNVARVLVALGHEVAVTGFLGGDNDGAFVRAFADWGLEDAFLRLAGDTRINAKVAEARGRVTDINGPGLDVSRDDLAALYRALEARLTDAATRPDAVVIAGSLPPGVAPDDLGALIRWLRAHDLPVWVDTSGAALSAAIAATPSAVKPNETELAEWAGEPLADMTARVAAATRLHAAGIEHALVSLGGEGMLWVGPQGSWQATPPPVEVASTVCAGDTLLAAMLHGQLAGLPAEDALRLASGLSAEAVRHVGVGDVKASDLEQLQQRTRVRRLDDGARETL